MSTEFINTGLDDFLVKSLTKGRRMPIGTISHGRKKVKEGQWVPVKEGGKTSVKDTFSDEKKNMTEGISYTFSNDSSVPEPIRGKTVYGGELKVRYIAGKLRDVYIFKKKIQGKTQIVIVDGKPELEAARNKEREKKNKKIENLERLVPGATKWKKVKSEFDDALIEYQSASDYGYPIKEARKLNEKESKLKEVLKKYTKINLWAKIIRYKNSNNISKTIIGKEAEKRVFEGKDIEKVVLQMENEWHEEALKLVMNS